MPMELKIYSIRDIKGDTFNAPFYKNTHGEAERDFTKLANDEKSQVKEFPEDYQLFHIGKYNTQTGVITPLLTPEHVVDAAQLVRKMQ